MDYYKKPEPHQLIDLLDQEWDKVKDDKNIHGIGIAFKEIKGEPVDELCIQYVVNKKMPASSLLALATLEIPPFHELQALQIPTDVVERRYKLNDGQELDPQRVTRQDIIQPGMSIGALTPTGGTLGTLGCFVKKGDQLCMLSNWHVLQGVEDNDEMEVIQPGLEDDLDGDHIIGDRLASHLSILGDLAIAVVHSGVQIDPTILGLDVVPTDFLDKKEVKKSMKVVKSGRTTGITHGKVYAIGRRNVIEYAGEDKTIGGFEIRLDKDFHEDDTEISGVGDSGAIWMLANDDGTATSTMAGIHFAGEDADGTQEFALACYADDAFSTLGISL